MLPSEELRQSISTKHNINLEDFAWSEEFKQQVFSTPLDNYLEKNAHTLGEIYEQGFNIGYCGLTSRYIARQFSEAELFYGHATLLKGTKNSPNGEHAWTVINNFLIDSTLMLCIPINEIQKLGYTPKREIAHNSARLLSENEVYNNEYELQKQKGITYKKTN